MKDVHKILLQLLKEIDYICTKYHITYYVAGGTTIGAVRHKGFIPWDDDADIYMTRDNFYRFRDAFHVEKPEGRALGCIEDYPGYPGTIPRYIDTETTNIARFNILNTCPAGFLVDIFILDPVPSDAEAQRYHRNLLNVYADFIMPDYGFSYRNDDDYIGLYEKYLTMSKKVGTDTVVAVLEEKLFSYPEDECEYYMLRWGSLCHLFPKNMMGKPVYFPYEGYPLPLPGKWYDYLVQLYGIDWMYIPQFIEDEGHIFVSDKDLSYKVYMNDAEQFIDRDTLRKELILRKKSLVKTTEMRRDYIALETELYSKYIISKLTSAQEHSQDLDVLLAQKEYGKILDMFSDYLDIQFSKDYVGKMRHAMVYRYYNPILIELSDKEFYCLIYSMAATGNLKKAIALMKLVKQKGNPDSMLDKLDVILNNSSYLIECYYTGNMDEAVDILKSIPEDFADNAIEIKRIDLSLKLINNPHDKSIMSEINDSLLKFDNDIEIEKVSGDYYYLNGDQKAAEAIYKRVLDNTRNGIIILELKNKTGKLSEADENSGRIQTNHMEPVTKTGREYLKLLSEVNDICRKAGIEYSLSGNTLMYAKNFGIFKSEILTPSIMMNSNNAEKFIDYMENNRIQDREIVYQCNDDSHYSYSIFYCDTDSTNYNLVSDNMNYMHVTIVILKRRADNVIKQYYTRLLEIADYLDNTSADRLEFKGKVARACSKAVIATNGGKDFRNKLFFREMNNGKNENQDYFITSNHIKQVAKYYMPANIMDSFETVKLYGREFRSVTAYDTYVTCCYGKYAEDDLALRPDSHDINSIIDPEMSNSEMQSIMDRSLHEDPSWISFSKSFGYAKESKMGSKAYKKSWRFIERTEARIKLWKEYEPQKDIILKMDNDHNIDGLRTLLYDYDVEARRFYKYKMGMCFDKEIMEVYLKLLKDGGEGDLAEKMREMIPPEHLEKLLIEL